MGQIIVDILPRLLARDADIVCQREFRNSVDDAEVDGLGVTAHQRRDLLRLHAEDLRGRRRVDIGTGAERLLHGLIVRDMGQHAQLDLAVVRVDKDAAVARHEHLADLAAELRADGDVLQVRVGGRQSARRRDHVLEGRVNAAVVRDLLDEAVGVRALELGHGTEIEDGVDDRVLATELFQHVRVRGVAAFRLLARRQAELVKEDLPELLGGVDVEFLPGIAEDRLLRSLDPALEHIAEGDERHLVRLDARSLHFSEHAAERQLDLVIELLHAVLRELFRQSFIERADGRGLRQAGADARGVFSDLLAVRAADGKAQMLLHNAVQVVAAPRRVKIIGGQRGVEDEALRRVSLFQQTAHQRLAVMRDLFDGGAEYS